MKKQLRDVVAPLHANFLLSLVAMLGSLYFSEILKLAPCTLCWYQRSFMYPLVLVFGVALWSEDSNYKKYGYALASTGLAIAAYHNLLYYGVISEALAPCTREISCSKKQLELFGFLTIPLLSLFSFAITIALLKIDRVSSKESK